jgi:hypothetical protein
MFSFSVIQASNPTKDEHKHMNAPNIANKLLLALCIAIAAVIGLAPAVYFLNSPKLLAYFAPGAALIAFIYFLTGDRGKSTGYQSRLLDYVLVGLVSVSTWATLGIMWLIFYGLTYGAMRLVKLLVGWFSLQVAINASSVAFYVTLIFSLIFAIACALASAQTIIRQLNSGGIGIRAAFYNRKRRAWVYLALSLLALMVMAASLWIRGNNWAAWFYPILQLLPYFSGYWLIISETRMRKESDTLRAIGRLLESAGYKIIFCLPSGDDVVDYLLSGMNMLVNKGEKYFAIKVKTSSASLKRVEWSVAAKLHMKVNALQRPDICQRIGMPELAETKITPLIILVGREPAQSLIEFLKEHHLPIITVSMEAIKKALETKDQDELKGIAHEIFSDPEHIRSYAATAM